MCQQAVGGHRVLPVWGMSMACAGDVSGAWEHVDKAQDGSPIYAITLDYIHLHAWASAVNEERGGGRGRRYTWMRTR